MEKNLSINNLIKNYLASRKALQDAGILRTDRNLQGDYAEWLVANKLSLKLSESTTQKGFDASDAEGKTYQIKSRMVYAKEQPASFDFKNFEHRFDYLIGVLFNKELELIGMIKVPFLKVVEHSVQNKNNYRFRWHRGLFGKSYIEHLM